MCVGEGFPVTRVTGWLRDCYQGYGVERGCLKARLKPRSIRLAQVIKRHKWGKEYKQSLFIAVHLNKLFVRKGRHYRLGCVTLLEAVRRSGRWAVGGGPWEVGHDRWNMIGGTWEVGHGRWDMRGGPWEVGHGRWAMGGGPWEAGHGRWAMGGGPWEVGQATRGTYSIPCRPFSPPPPHPRGWRCWIWQLL